MATDEVSRFADLAGVFDTGVCNDVEHLAGGKVSSITLSPTGPTPDPPSK
jgi:hypothetical protein